MGEMVLPSRILLAIMVLAGVCCAVLIARRRQATKPSAKLYLMLVGAGFVSIVRDAIPLVDEAAAFAFVLECLLFLGFLVVAVSYWRSQSASDAESPKRSAESGELRDKSP